MTTAEVLKSARAKIAIGWCQGTAMVDAQGRPSGPGDATCYCAIAACHAATPDVLLAGDLAYSFLCRVVPGGRVSSWQDAPEHTKAEVLELFDRAIVLAESEAA